MTKKRASLGSIDDETKTEPTDITTFAPGTAARRPTPSDRAAQDAGAVAQGFTSREGPSPSAGRKGRALRPKSPFTEQLNIKVTPEDLETFLDWRDEGGVIGGKVFADMIVAMRRARDEPE